VGEKRDRRGGEGKGKSRHHGRAGKWLPKKPRFFKNLKTSEVQNVGFGFFKVFFCFLVKFYTDHII